MVDVPPELICPITAEVMVDPVITADGHTYDREAIELWLARKATSPLTGEPLAHTHLTPNHTVRAMCHRFGGLELEGRTSSLAAAAVPADEDARKRVQLS